MAGVVGSVRYGWDRLGFFRQARSDLVLCVQVGLGVVQRGRLGEVGIGVVCKVLSGRQGGVRSDWVRRNLARFGVAGSVGCVWIRRGVVRFGRCGE